MDKIDDDARIAEVVGLLERALTILDEMKEHSAAAQIDNVLHAIQASEGADHCGS